MTTAAATRANPSTSGASAHAGGGAAGRGRPGRRRARIRESLVGYAFIGPNLLLLTVFLLVPILWAVQLSFQATRGFGDPDWVGGANYAQIGRAHV